MLTRLAWFCCALQVVLTASAEEAVRLDVDSGLLAIREHAEDEWTVRHSGDELPTSFEFRVGPASAGRLDVLGARLTLAGESTGHWNGAERRLTLRRGQALCRVDADAAALRFTSPSQTPISWQLPGGAEVLWQQQDGEAWHLIAGEMQRSNDGARTFAAPMTLRPIADNGVEETVPEQPASWSERLLKWTRSAQGPGQLIAKDAQDGSPVRLEIARYRVNVVLEAPVALVQIDQSFYNPFGSQQEGTFVFNLPPGASVSRFAMFVTPEQLIEGELINRKEADRIYTSIVRRRRDPAILEQIGDNLFRMRVFPIFARDTKRILLDYTIPLVSERGQYRFELPLLSDLKPIWDFSIKGTIYPPVDAGQIRSLTHPQLKFTARDDGRATFAMSEQMVRPQRSLQISYPAPADRRAAVRSFQSEREALREYFVATIPASENPVLNEPGTPADVMIVVDTSGSAGNLNRARLAVRTIVNQLRPDDRLQLGCVDVDFRPLTHDWLVPDDMAVRDAYQQLQAEFSLGGSSLDQSLDRALAELIKTPSPRRKMLIYIGDGVSTMQLQKDFWKPYLDQPQESRPTFSMVRVGRNPGEARWMQQAVLATAGRSFDLEQSPSGFDDLFEWSLEGLPTPRNRVEVEVEGLWRPDVLVDAVWPTGKDLHILGRRTPAAELKLKIMVEDLPAKSYELAVPPTQQDDAVFTGRLWAQRKLELQLEDYERAKGRDQEVLHHDIVSLCQQWSLMSPLTAFLVLESEEDYARWKIDRQLRQRYWSPPEALPAIPLPDHVRPMQPTQFGNRNRGQFGWPAQNEAERLRQTEQWDREFTAESLAQARKALDNGDAVTAHLQLVRVRDRALKLQPELYQELYRQVSVKLERENALQQLGMWRPLADRLSTGLYSPAQPFLPLLMQGGLDPDYLDRNPHALKLMQPIKVPSELTVRDFATALQKQLGMPVLVYEKEITEDGNSADQHVYTEGLEGISAVNFIRHALEPYDLALVADKHVFYITTVYKAQERQTNKLYPVGDLLRTDILPPPNRLSNPQLDFEEFTRRRMEARLQQPISVDFVDVQLRDALQQIGEKIGLPFRLNAKEITEDGGSVDQPVTLSLSHVPADIVLQNCLQPCDLTHLISREVLMVTTIPKAEERMETRVYSAAGLADGLAPDPVRNPNQWGMGMGMSGMGGFGMGGGMIGGMGGMGGGMGGGGGIGGFGGAMGGSPEFGFPSSQEAGLSETEPLEPEDNAAVDVAPAPAPVNPAPSFQVPNLAAGGPAATNIGPAMRLIQENTSGEWANEEGVGGEMSWFPNSLSLVVTQPARIHRELQEMFAKMREFADRDPASQMRRPRVRQIGAEQALRNYGPLMRVLQNHTSGEWADDEGVGGRMQTHAVTYSLSIRQTQRVHQEIEALLAQLRRARYVAETIPTREYLNGIDNDLSLFDQPVLTNLPRGDVVPVIADEARAEMLKRLAVRQPAQQLNQRWRRIVNGSQTSELALRRFDGRLELEIPDRVLRAAGPQAAVGYPRLGLVELDAWGESVRKLADAKFPWLPHRDNEELVAHFEVAALGESPESVTLGLTFRKSRDVQIRAEFSKADGRPLSWKVMNGEETQYELKFAADKVTAVAADGKELERWELISSDAPRPVPELADFGPHWAVVQVAETRDAMTSARTALRQGEYVAATAAFRRWKDQQPDQPLVNFLFAWCSEFAHKLNAADLAEQRSALQKVVESEATDLVRWLNPTFFPSLGADGLLELLFAIPEERRSAAVCDQIVELAQGARRYPEALAALRRSLQLEPERPAAAANRLLMVELLLRTRDVPAAITEAETAIARGATASVFCEIGDLFYRFEQPQLAADFYARATAAEKLTPLEQAQLLARQAVWLIGEPRWQKLFDAEQALPDNARERGVYLATLLYETQSATQVPLLLRLAKDARRPEFRRKLQIHAAELTADRPLAAQIAWELFQEHGLPVDRVTWMLQRLINADRGRDVIPVLEQRLRRGEKLDRQTLSILAAAYRQERRTIDADRADSHNLDVPVSENQPQRNARGIGFF